MFKFISNLFNRLIFYPFAIILLKIYLYQFRKENPPNNKEELINRFHYDKEIINENKLKEFLPYIDSELFLFVDHILILTKEQIDETVNDKDNKFKLVMEVMLDLNDEDTKQYGFYSIIDRVVIIHLENHVKKDEEVEEWNKNLLDTLLHELRHAWQSDKKNNFLPFALEDAKQRLGMKTKFSSDKVESDAEEYANKETERLYSHFPKDLVNWDYLENKDIK